VYSNPAYPQTIFEAIRSSGQSTVKADMRRYSDSGSFTQQFPTPLPGLLGADFPCVPGTWNVIRAHMKQETTRGVSNDGLVRLYVNGVKIGERAGRDYGGRDEPLDEPRGLNRGFLLGDANSGFDEVTPFHIDYMRWYDVDPGWEA
jgi:hypothetical protein